MVSKRRLWPGPRLTKTRVWRLSVCLLALLSASCVRGCTSSRPPIHIVPDMDRQPKYLPQAESTFFYDGATMRLPVEGTVARGELVEDPTFLTGMEAEGVFVVENRMETTPELLDRGQFQYSIYCTPCHGEDGSGQGMLAARGGIPVANLHQDRLRQMPDGQMFDVLTRGLGLMSSYRYPLQPADRWAIVAYVRRLQEEFEGEPPG